MRMYETLARGERSERRAANKGGTHATKQKHVRGTCRAGPRGEVISTRETRPPVEESVFARSSRGTASAAVAPPYTHTHTHTCTQLCTQGRTGRASARITRRPAAQLAASSGPGVSGLESLATVISVGPSCALAGGGRLDEVVPWTVTGGERSAAVGSAAPLSGTGASWT